jgi:DNA polymerase (family 10)
MNPIQYFITDTYSQDRLHGQAIIRLADTLAKRLSPYATKITIAGSIRRGSLNPSDIDMIMIPKNREGILHTINTMGGKVWSEGPTQTYFKIQGINVNIYYTTQGSYGAQLLHTTGSGPHNIGLRRIAQKKGYTLNQYGLYKGRKQVAGRTEESIYKALGRPRYKKPGERQ